MSCCKSQAVSSPIDSQSPAHKPVLNVTSGNDKSFGVAKSKVVVMCGNSGVGKTTICRRILNGKFDPTTNSTIGVDFVQGPTKEGPSKGPVPGLTIWDTAGQERFQSMAASYYRNARAVIAVFDITSSASYEALPQWVMNAYAANPASKEHKCVLLVIGTKRDMIKKPSDRVDVIGIEKHFEPHKIDYYGELSSQSGYGFNTFLAALKELAGTCDIVDTRSKLMDVLSIKSHAIKPGGRKTKKIRKTDIEEEGENETVVPVENPLPIVTE